MFGAENHSSQTRVLRCRATLQLAGRGTEELTTFQASSGAIGVVHDQHLGPVGTTGALALDAMLADGRPVTLRAEVALKESVFSGGRMRSWLGIVGISPDDHKHLIGIVSRAQ